MMERTTPLILRPAPQIRTPRTTMTIMRDVLIALAPAAVASVYLFGWRAAAVIVLSVASCVAFEWVWCRARKIEDTTRDLSCAVTGVLLAFNLPSTIPLGLVVLGAFVAIIVTKELFGGIGKNVANPAVVGRIFLALSYPVAMATFVEPLATADLVSQATPLAPSAAPEPWVSLLLGTHAGALGETCAAALIVGTLYLIWRRVITWHIPVAYLATVAVCSLVTGHDVVSQLLSGGLMLGAGFMATDYTTTPETRRGKVVFAVGCGLVTCLIRFCGNLNEGVAYSILLMNLLVHHIDALTHNVPLGAEKAAGGGKHE